MSSVIEEPRHSTSTTSEYIQHSVHLYNYTHLDSKISIFSTPFVFCLLPMSTTDLSTSVHIISKRLISSTHFTFCLCTPDVSDMQEQDPLADATYIRANFTYIPRTPKELQIKAGDVFHIHDEVMFILS